MSEGIGMGAGIRRVVTGLDEQGRSTVLIDDRQSSDGRPFVLWRTDTLPADNSGRDDMGAAGFAPDLFRSPGSTFLLFELPPGEPGAEPFRHATDTVDYIVVLKGRIELTLDTGSVELEAGDCIVQRGVLHSWRALDGQPATSIGVMVPARPVGAGATV